ncbi:MAG TPA: methyltransferase domain-containing protein [Thermohalobaculum sp.]|nr:methyltransferase domain-containing protein [Thermohalobaculum sp.]
MFDFPALAGRRDRAMRLGFAGGADFLHREVAALIAERLGEINRAFRRVALIGTGAGAVAAALGRSGAALRQLDPSPAMARAAGAEVLAGEVLPLAEGAHDLVVSTLLLHAMNDPVGQLIQMRRALAPDGLMLAALFGGRTLAELRASLAEAEAEVEGGLSLRVAPMAEIRDLGGLLQRAGYAMPVADSQTLTVTYATPLHLMRELRAMGETNIVRARRRQPMRRATLMRACEIYARHFGAPDGRVRATFEIVFLTGWAPGPDQPQPLRPGSARARLADALGTNEIGSGIKTGIKPGIKPGR